MGGVRGIRLAGGCMRHCYLDLGRIFPKCIWFIVCDGLGIFALGGALEKALDWV